MKCNSPVNPRLHRLDESGYWFNIVGFNKGPSIAKATTPAAAATRRSRRDIGVGGDPSRLIARSQWPVEHARTKLHDGHGSKDEAASRDAHRNVALTSGFLLPGSPREALQFAVRVHDITMAC